MNYSIFQSTDILSPEILKIREFRNKIYSLDNVELSCQENFKDLNAWHITAKISENLIGCLRYTPTESLTDRPSAFVGGWAVESGYQMTPLAIKLLFIGYAIGQFLGGSIVSATATTKNNSSKILQKVGGVPLQAYYDVHYQADMVLFEFDTLIIDAKYSKLLSFGKNIVKIHLDKNKNN